MADATPAKLPSPSRSGRLAQDRRAAPSRRNGQGVSFKSELSEAESRQCFGPTPRFGLMRVRCCRNGPSTHQNLAILMFAPRAGRRRTKPRKRERRGRGERGRKRERERERARRHGIELTASADVLRALVPNACDASSRRAQGSTVHHCSASSIQTWHGSPP